MGGDRDTPMVGGGSDDEVSGSDIGDDDDPQSFVGPSDPDDPIDAGETGAEARSEQKRAAGGSS
jgi:hypothetical protein